ncbi:MAG: RNA-binding protein [Candidatus Thermoplasmatota archaeon]|nr:RNA-binding protein [Candidatus Thermoplasmatota archaeon]
MRELAVKHRSRLRVKDSRKVHAWIREEWGTAGPDDPELESCTLDGKRSYILNGQVIGMEEGGGFLLTLKGILDLKPSRKWVTVDMGAVKYLANGADVMAPGIIDADPGIEIGDLVWVRDERNLRPLCVGQALMQGVMMGPSDSGKAVKTIHYVGDQIWNTVV